MKRFFIVEVPEIYTSKMVIMANSAEEATALVQDGGGMEKRVSYSETLDPDSNYEVGEWETYEIESGITALSVGASVIYAGTDTDSGSWLLVDVEKSGEALLYRTVNGREEFKNVPAPLVHIEKPATPEYVLKAKEIMWLRQ